MLSSTVFHHFTQLSMLLIFLFLSLSLKTFLLLYSKINLHFSKVIELIFSISQIAFFRFEYFKYKSFLNQQFGQV